MKTYHVCECCDQVFKISNADEYTARKESDDLTEGIAKDIMKMEPKNGNILIQGLCEECREEVYGSGDQFVYPSRLH